jgi:hypothetical protein
MQSEKKITRANAPAILKQFADENNLPKDWMNADFTKTDSKNYAHCQLMN